MVHVMESPNADWQVGIKLNFNNSQKIIENSMNKSFAVARTPMNSIQKHFLGGRSKADDRTTNELEEETDANGS